MLKKQRMLTSIDLKRGHLSKTHSALKLFQKVQFRASNTTSFASKAKINDFLKFFKVEQSSPYSGTCRNRKKFQNIH